MLDVEHLVCENRGGLCGVKTKERSRLCPGYSVVDKLFVVVHTTNVYIRFHMVAILIIAHSKLISWSGMH